MIRIPIDVFVENDVKFEPESVSCDVNITDLIADVVYCVSYKNNLSNKKDARIRFPLKSKAAVYFFEAKIGEKTIRGKCMEKEEAERNYKEAVKKGIFAFYGFYETEDIFAMDVGNIDPEESVSLILRYIVQLDFTESTKIFTFTLPIKIIPRYDPACPEMTKCFKKQVPEFVPFFKFNGTVTGGEKKIEEIYSNVDQLNFGRQTDSEYNLTMPHLPQKMDDLCIYVRYSDVNLFTAIIEKGLDDPILMLSHIPSFEEKRLSEMTQEFIFVIDRSGSMMGSSIKRAAEALRIGLLSLPPKARYNIIGFGSDFDLLFEKSVLVEDADKRRRALRYVAHIQADMGGTEILNPIKHVFREKLEEGYSRKIILITDGSVSNYNQVIYEVSLNSVQNRVFSVGIGSGASSKLVEGIAEAGNGKFEFVDSSATDIDSKIIQLMGDATKSVITGQTLQFGDHNLEDYFPKGRSVYINNLPYIDFFKVKDAGKFEETPILKINYSGFIEGIRYEKTAEIPVVFTERANLPVHRFAVKDYLAKISYNYSDQQFNENKDQIKSSALALSLSANIASRVTSFLGIADDDSVIFKTPEKSQFMVYSTRLATFSNLPVNTSFHNVSAENCEIDGSWGETTCDTLMDTIGMQRFDGLFIAEDEFFTRNSSVDKEGFERELDSLKNISRDQFFTILCIVFIEKFFQHKAQVVQLILRKAVDVLGMDDHVMKSLKDRASSLIRD